MEQNSLDSPAVDRLRDNYSLLHSQYRLGKFEGHVGYSRKWQPSPTEEIEFYEMCKSHEAARAGKLKFASAIQDLYRLTTYLEKTKPVNNDLILLLKCKCLIYEAKDYSLNVPAELGQYFVNHVEGFPDNTRDVVKLAESLKSGEFRDKDERASVIKLLLVAGLCGVNQLYRAHNSNSYNRAFINLEKLNKFIQDELPNQHETPRQSFGIAGLSQYWTGQVLAKKGLMKESRRAFRASTEAYVARLRQKEDFFRTELIKSSEFEAKVSVTIRRAALIAAFGYGQHYFANGQLTRSLESLTLARAALTRNSGLVYLNHVDMFYWACRRAANSSNRDTIEGCIHGLEDCYTKFGELTPDSEYFHQTGIQLALALFYRAQLTGDPDGSAYRQGLGYLDAAIAYAKSPGENLISLNPNLLASALITKSRYFSAKYVRDKKSNADRSYEYLNKARFAAQEAREASDGMEMRSQATSILGNVYVDLAKLDRKRRSKTFQSNFDIAYEMLQVALMENNSQNVRNEAVCYLYLSRLLLLNPGTETAAHDYFAKWEKISSIVEHDYCKTLAKELKLKLGPRILVVRLEKDQKFKHWKQKVFDFLLDESLTDFAQIHRGKNYNRQVLKKLLIIHLEERLGYGSQTVTRWFGNSNLIDEVKRRLMNEPPSEVRWKNRDRTNPED